jgi:hypothetical protein
MKYQTMNLNIRYDAPKEIWDKVYQIYPQLEGWQGFKEQIPYWFSFDEDEKHICASLEPSGLLFDGLMPDEEWEKWVIAIKEIATRELGYKVGEIELGEVED